MAYSLTVVFGITFVIGLAFTIYRLGFSVAILPLAAMCGAIVAFFALFEHEGDQPAPDSYIDDQLEVEK